MTKRTLFFIYEAVSSSWCYSSKQVKFDEFIDATIFSSLPNAMKAVRSIKAQVKAHSEFMVRGKLTAVHNPSFRIQEIAVDLEKVRSA